MFGVKYHIETLMARVKNMSEAKKKKKKKKEKKRKEKAIIHALQKAGKTQNEIAVQVWYSLSAIEDNKMNLFKMVQLQF